MQSLLYSCGGGITSGKRNRTSVNEKLEAAELAAQRKNLFVNRERSEGEEILTQHSE